MIALGIILFLATSGGTTLSLFLVLRKLRAETFRSSFQVWSCHYQPSEEGLMAFLYFYFLSPTAKIQESFSPKQMTPFGPLGRCSYGKKRFVSVVQESLWQLLGTRDLHRFFLSQTCVTHRAGGQQTDRPGARTSSVQTCGCYGFPAIASTKPPVVNIKQGRFRQN